MGREVYINQSKPVAKIDTGTVSLTVTDNAGFQTIQTIRLRGGYTPKLGLGLDVAPGAAAFASFRVLVNGSPSTDDLLNSITSNPGSTTDPDALDANMRELPEGALVQIQGQLVSAGANYALYSRARVEYHEKA